MARLSPPFSESVSPVSVPPREGTRDAIARLRFRSTGVLQIVLAGVLTLLGLGAAGCGRSREVLGKVSGTVTLQGQPLSEGRVIFSNPDKGVHMTAKLRPDGSYTVVMATGPGLPLGPYKVSITPPVVEPSLDPLKAPPKLQPTPNIPEKYLRPETSGLTLTVNEGENRLDVDMKP